MAAKPGLFGWLLATLPPAHGLTSRAIRRDNEASDIAHSIRGTWQNPTDILTILFIVGGDVVARALAQLAGPILVPVAFSFGWVAYSFAVLVNVFGDGRLMPAPEGTAKIFNIKSGISRDNRSWVLGRLLRDMERPLDKDVAMNVSVYKLAPPSTWASWDWCYISGLAVILLQLGIAAIPCGLYEDWGVLLVTGSGILICLVTGSLPQWHLEKYAGRRGKRKVVALTRGNGSRNVIIIINAGERDGVPGSGMEIDLEDLAAAQPPTLRFGAWEKGHRIFGMPADLRLTQLMCIIFAWLWIALLITVEALDTHPWYLLLVGGIGMLQNVIVAGAKRTPAAHGIHVELVESFADNKVMRALMDVELAYPGVGKALVNEFFSAGLRPEETAWWGGTRLVDEDKRVHTDSVEVNAARAEYVTLITPKPLRKE